MLPIEPRTVKPRKPVSEWLPIIVASREYRTVYVESTGQVHGWTDLPALLRAHQSSILVAPNMAYLLTELEREYACLPNWHYKVTPVKREPYTDDPTRRKRVIRDTIVNYLGWRDPVNPKRPGHWHFPIDPGLFCTTPIRELTGDSDVMSLLAWAGDLREWCNANGLRISATAGGLGGQLLRDPRWYPDARRKAPRATNATARPLLPGNYFRLYHPERVPVEAEYLDMSSAHHNMAASIKFPCANDLYARGHFHTTVTTETTVYDKPFWSPRGSYRFQQLLGSYGLLLIQLNSPAIKQEQYPPPYMEAMGRRLAYVYTNELPLIEELGGHIEGIVAAWVSCNRDTGINHYAQWALAEIATMTPERKRWAKTVLLATYGNLAALARVREHGYRTGTGVQREYPAGPSTVTAYSHITETETELPTVNVIHRGMIEAQQRTNVLRTARWLTSYGHDILAIHADAIIIRAGRQLPLLPPPWRHDTHLTHLRFASAVGYTSVERTRLPGIDKADSDRWARTRLRGTITVQTKGTGNPAGPQQRRA